MTLRSALSRSPTAVRVIRAAKLFTSSLPASARFFDGRTRRTTRGVRRMFDLWRRHEGRDAESEAAYELYDGGDVLDVGAFHGWYGVLLSPKARAGATFVLIEPDPSAWPALRATAAELGRLFPEIRYEVVAAPAGDGSRVRAEYLHGPIGHPRFAEGVAGGMRSETLDSIMARLRVAPTFVKVDVEGAEAAVLQGAARVLADHAPSVMLETHPQWQPDGVSADVVAEPLRAAGYCGVVLNASELSVRELWRRPAAN